MDAPENQGKIKAGSFLYPVKTLEQKTADVQVAALTDF